MGLTITPTEIQVNEEGVSQGTANVVNFVGAAVATTITNDTATVTDIAWTPGQIIANLIFKER